MALNLSKAPAFVIYYNIVFQTSGIVPIYNAGIQGQFKVSQRMQEDEDGV